MYKFFKSKYIISSSEKIYEDSILVIKDGRIISIISEEQFKNLYNEVSCEITDFGNAVITPGFVNLHTHLQYTDLTQQQILKQVQDDKHIDFSDWIINLVKQYYFRSKEKKINSFKLGLKEAVLSGCTCIAQLSGEDFFPEIMNNLGLKAFIFLETFSNSEERTQKELKKLKDNINKLKEKCTDNIVLGISPHSPYNVHRSLWEAISDFASEENILVHTHLGEAQAEIDWLNGKPSGIDKLHLMAFLKKMPPYEKNLNPVEYLEKTGILDKLKGNLTLAHCIRLDERSLEKLVNFGAKIAHCPRSNMMLHKKTLDYNKLSEEICKNSGLGTDSRFSNYDLSILNEGKYIKDCTGLDSKKILNMLTINSARILKIDDKAGSLDENKDADFLVFKLPWQNSPETLINIILNQEKPDEIYIKGIQIAESGKFTAEAWKFLNEL